MSLLVCLRGTDGLVLATDSRGTFGDPRGVTAQNDSQKKLYLANERVGVMIAGVGELGANVMSGFLATPSITDMGVTALTTALYASVRQKYSDWFRAFSIQPNPRGHPVRPDLNFVISGYEETNASTKIYHLVASMDFAPMLHNYGFSLDGVAQYALYLLNRLYDGNYSVDQLSHLAAYVITETASQDGKVGGPVQMATIAPAQSIELTKGAVDQIIAANAARSKALKSSFLEKNGVSATSN
jgi:hypothetical protein